MWWRFITFPGLANSVWILVDNNVFMLFCLSHEMGTCTCKANGCSWNCLIQCSWFIMHHLSLFMNVCACDCVTFYCSCHLSACKKAFWLMTNYWVSIDDDHNCNVQYMYLYFSATTTCTCIICVVYYMYSSIETVTTTPLSLSFSHASICLSHYSSYDESSEQAVEIQQQKLLPGVKWVTALHELSQSSIAPFASLSLIYI